MDPEEGSVEALKKELSGPQPRYCIAVIPCKVTSLRLPKKNLRKVAGFSMLEWTIFKAMNCPDIDEIFISTDNADVLLEELPVLKEPRFDRLACYQRGMTTMGPDTPVYMLVMEVLQYLTVNRLLKRDPTNLVMLQPNVPSLPQETVDTLVKAVVWGPYNVARHFHRLGAMTGGCDAYKLKAFMLAPNMDAYNFAQMTDDFEVHNEEDLKKAEALILERGGPADAIL